MGLIIVDFFMWISSTRFPKICCSSRSDYNLSSSLCFVHDSFLSKCSYFCFWVCVHEGEKGLWLWLKVLGLDFLKKQPPATLCVSFYIWQSQYKTNLHWVELRGCTANRSDKVNDNWWHTFVCLNILTNEQTRQKCDNRKQELKLLGRIAKNNVENWHINMSGEAL